MIEYGVFHSSAVRNEHKKRELIALREGDHPGTHAQYPRILNEHRRAQPTQTGAAGNRQRFLLVGSPYKADGRLLFDAHKNFTEPAVRHRDNRADAQPFQRSENFGRTMGVWGGLGRLCHQSSLQQGIITTQRCGQSF